jgi:ADP-ribose pyrophosphatase
VVRIEFPDSACALVVGEGGEVVLVAQWRALHRVDTLELPGGNVAAGEEPAAAAARELAEETGYAAPDLRFAMTLDMDFSASIHRTHVFFGRLPAGRAPGPREEGIKAVRLIPAARALEMVESGEITHAPTVAALLWYARHRGDGASG